MFVEFRSNTRDFVAFAPRVCPAVLSARRVAKLFQISSTHVRCTFHPPESVFIGSRYLPTRLEHDTATPRISILVSDSGCTRVARTLMLFCCLSTGLEVSKSTYISDHRPNENYTSYRNCCFLYVSYTSFPTSADHFSPSSSMLHTSP